MLVILVDGCVRVSQEWDRGRYCVPFLVVHFSKQEGSKKQDTVPSPVPFLGPSVSNRTDPTNTFPGSLGTTRSDPQTTGSAPMVPGHLERVEPWGQGDHHGDRPPGPRPPCPALSRDPLSRGPLSRGPLLREGPLSRACGCGCISHLAIYLWGGTRTGFGGAIGGGGCGLVGFIHGIERLCVDT